MTEADRLSLHANVPHDLAELVVMGAERIGVPLSKLRSDCRDRPLAYGRFWVARKAREAGHSFPAIGRALNRDHSTILQGLRGRA